MKGKYPGVVLFCFLIVFFIAYFWLVRRMILDTIGWRGRKEEEEKEASDHAWHICNEAYDIASFVFVVDVDGVNNVGVYISWIAFWFLGRV